VSAQQAIVILDSVARVSDLQPHAPAPGVRFGHLHLTPPRIHTTSMESWSVDSLTSTWDRVKRSFNKRRASTSSASIVSASSNSSQISDDPNGPIYSTLQALFETTSGLLRNVARDARLNNVREPLRTLVAQVVIAKESIDDPDFGNTIVLGSKLPTLPLRNLPPVILQPINHVRTDSAHSKLVMLYDDSRLLYNNFAPDGSLKPLRLLDKETLEEFTRSVAEIQASFERWSTIYLQPAINLRAPKPPTNTIDSTATNQDSPLGTFKFSPRGSGSDNRTVGYRIAVFPEPAPGTLPDRPPAPLEKKHQCKVCDKRFTRPTSLQTHMYNHTGEKRMSFSLVSCNGCHLLTAYLHVAFVCEVEGCGREFAVVSNLRRHKKVHRKMTP